MAVKISLFLTLFAGILCLIGRMECIHPVVLVPGDAGSRMMAKLDKPGSNHNGCERKTGDYFTLWLNVSQLMNLNCFAENMRLVYNNVTRKTKNVPGVYTKVPGFGNTSTIEYLDPNHSIVPGHYYAIIVDALVKRGFRRGISVRGAPYDFRKAPNELEEYFINLKYLIEETYRKNGNKTVILVGHSMGSPMVLYFLNRQIQIWKDKYIRCFVSISGPYGGSVKAVLSFVSGYNFGSSFLDRIKLRLEERTNPSLSFFMPSPHFWNKSEVLVKTPNRHYTAQDYKQLFSDINWNTGYEMWLDTKGLISIKNAPGVEVHCLHGDGVKTPEMMTYDEGFPNSAPVFTYGPGDGTVNLKSLQACQEWYKYQKQKVYHKTFPGVSHLGILRSTQTLKYLSKLALEY